MKEKILNKKIIAIIVAMTIVLPFLGEALGLMPNPFSSLFAAEKINNEKIRILEIQPTNKFWLGTQNSTTGSQNLTVSNKHVTLERITMAEFIGRVDKINGKYDVIVIGRYTNSSGNDYNFKDYTLQDNDITNRKADEIKEFIKSGQLVYIDDSIKSRDGINTSTKLYKRLGPNNDNELVNLSNLKRANTESNSFTLTSIISEYDNITNKRAIVEVTEYPQGDNGKGNGLEINRKLKYKFNIKSNSSENSNVDVKLYLDINGDGLFKGEEVVDSINSLSIPSTDIEMKYSLHKDFIGYVDWKLEIIDSNGVKSYVNSGFKVNKLEGISRTIRVLQVMQGADNNNQSSSGKDGILNLEENTKFQQLLTETYNNYGYDIKIDSIGTNNFYKNKEYISVKGVEKQLNGDYDMLIVGFNDWYNTSYITDKAIEEMIKFANTGQGIMLTHDTTFYENGKLSDDTKSNRYRVTRALADYIGQSRYINDFNITGKDFTGKVIPHDPDKQTYSNPTNNQLQEQMGGTIWRRKNSSVGSSWESSKIYKTNDALITSYPYEMNPTTQNPISVRRTHAQYLQLNFEDEDVVPWINLGEGSINKYDSRNSYYTYSKGNITFSGTGENKRDSNEYPEIEFKLFINTIIKAERGANHAPTISSNIEKSTTGVDLELSTAQEIIDFRPLVEDIDNDKVNVKVMMSYTDKTTGEVVFDKQSLTQGKEIALSIKNPYYGKTESEIQNKQIKIKVEAIDSKKASATPVEYIIKPISEPTIGIKYDNNKGLVGDNIQLNINLEKLNLKNQKIDDVKLKVLEKSSTITGINVNQVNDVTEFNNNIADFTYNICTTIEGTHDIKLEVSYKLNGQEKSLRDPIIIRVYSKEGKISLKTIDSMGNTIKDFIGDVTLSGQNGFNSSKSVYGLNGGRYSWPDYSNEKITTSLYELNLKAKESNSSSANTYSVQSYQISNESDKIISSGSEGRANIGIIDYDNPKVEVTYTIKRDKPISVVSNDQLRILEVQPGNNFKITNKNPSSTTAGTEYIVDEEINTENNNNIKNIIIDHIPMPEFIGKVEQLNGLYDVIVIGRESSGGGENRDYSQLNNNGSENNYKENDITERKSKEIKEFIESGQTVYMDKDINNTNISQSNIYKLYNSMSANLDIEEYDTINLQAIISKYKDNLNKRPIISVSSPLGDESAHLWKDEQEAKTGADTLGSLENRNMEFKVNITEDKGYSGNYNANLYLDINGDGKYTPEEIFRKVENISVSQDGLRLVYNMPTDFVGQLNWKLELETQDSRNIKTYILGEVNFRRITENGKKVVKVLQIRPNVGLDLSGDTRFKSWCNLVKDYVINIDTVSISEYNTRANSTYVGNDKITLNGNYDMVILGFANVYGQKDISNASALDQIEKFIQSGQGVMFTHDTMLYDYYTNSAGNGPQNIRKRFRDYVGQTRFKPITGNENDQTFSEGHYVDLKGNNGNIWGYTRYVSSLKQANKVQQTNSALITDYPYDLAKTDASTYTTTETKANELSVRQTHTQWFQLNFEDPEVVPWYNIKGENDVFDSRNSYYTYSKGNITFSGTGEHSLGGDYPNSELQLFVNTIIKAERGANHAPVVDSTIPERPEETYDIEIDHNKNYTFKARATDIDNDKVKLQVSVKRQSDESWDIIRPYSENYINQGEYLNPDTIIDKSKWQGNSGNILEVKIEAKDEHGATSSKVYRLLPTNNPQFTIIPGSGEGLVGEEISANINLQKVNMGGSNDIRINKISLGDYDKSVFSDIVLPNISNVSYDNNQTNIMIKTKTISESNHFLPIIIEYQVYKTSGNASGDIYNPKTVEIKVPISSKNGVITLNIRNEDDTTVLPNVTLKKNGSNISTTNINSMSHTWPDSSIDYLLSGNYSVVINNLEEMDATILEQSVESIDLNYGNPTATIEIKISTGKDGQVISHGIFTQKGDEYAVTKSPNEPNTQSIIKGMYYTIGTEINVLRNNSQLTVTLQNVEDLESSRVLLYEVYEDKKIKEISSGEVLSINNNIITVTKLLKNKKYIVVYTTKFKGEADLISELINLNVNSSKILRLNIQSVEGSTDGLPELF